MNKNWDDQEEWLLSKYLIQRANDRATGQSEDECLRNYPRDVYFIGNLSPALSVQNIDSSSQGDYSNEFLNKLSPVAFGAEFRLGPNSNEIIIDVLVNWNCYYRVIPSYAQQLEHRGRQQMSDIDNDSSSNTAYVLNSKSNSEIDSDKTQNGISENIEIDEDTKLDESSDTVNLSAHDRRKARSPKDSFFIRFKKINCSASGKVVLYKNNLNSWFADTSKLRDELSNEVKRARNIAITDSERIHTNGTQDDNINVPDVALECENSFNVFLQTLKTDVVPIWQWDIKAEIRKGGAIADQDDLFLFFEFTNISPISKNSPNTEAFFFNISAAFTFNGCTIYPFDIDLAPKGFRYDRELWGRGFNCAVEVLDKSHNTFKTQNTPIYTQWRYLTREKPTAPFKALAVNPIPVLEEILHEMYLYCEVWEHAKQEYIGSNPNWGKQYGSEFDNDYNTYKNEISRFNIGLDLIRSNKDIQLAFRLTNETFSRGSKNAWRLFQIVFLVSQIPGIAAHAYPNSYNLEELNKVDIVYFPTGGGKTEAYLATLIFHCFFDRLRGKAAGVTAWTRFPLRLLTLQQTQRVADVIGQAELVRKGQTDIRLNSDDIDGFAVGYFVGEGGSPNEIVDPSKDRYCKPESQVLWSKVNDPVVRQQWKRVTRCPCCKTATVTVDFDKNKCRLLHRCTNQQCKFPQGIIPVYIVDNEIYRYLPSVIVGTIDKLAGIGNQRKLSLIFGKVDGRCTEHGYYKGKCCQKDCTLPKRLKFQLPKGISGPTLFVQDELHLLKEGLGTFDAHYETFIQTLRNEFGQTTPLKIIASSATIEAFERQVEHLYGRDKIQARVFPGLGPCISESFYAETLNYPQRLYVGIIPHNKTIFNTILEILEYYHCEVQKLQRLNIYELNPYGGVLQPCTTDFINLLDIYSTSLTYFLAGRELNSLRTDLDGDVSPNMMRNKFLPLSISELTGSTSTDEVTKVLEHLEKPAQINTPPDAVLATSMVSHGVDVDRFNTMIFYGMPRQNAEYIQASSRVGRSHVGIVFCVLHPTRERDQSHYTYFVKFHEFLGQLVEPVAINRWSKFSINRTLPGLFMGILLQIISNQSGERNPNMYYKLDFVKKKICDNNIQPDDFIPLLEDAYGVSSGRSAEEIAFKKQINLQVRQFFDQIIGAGSGYSFISDVLIPKPMRSLRDVDEPIEIELDRLGTEWGNKTT